MANLKESREARQAAMERLKELMTRRQEYVAGEARRQRGLYDEELGQTEKDWGDPAVKGAALGGSVGGPWGALIGGIAGTAKGQLSAFKQRRKEGQNPFEAAWRTAFDVGQPLKGAAGSLGSVGAGAYGIKSHMARQPAARQPTSIETMENLQLRSPQLGRAEGPAYGGISGDRDLQIGDEFRFDGNEDFKLKEPTFGSSLRKRKGSY